MGAKVYCLASAKGGSGKTIVAASLANFLSSVGKKCAIIDCDAATHGMTLLYIGQVSEDSAAAKKGLFDFGEVPRTWDEILDSIITLENGIDLLPATYEFSADFDPESRFSNNILAGIMNFMRAEYDLIFLDAQAGSDKFSRLSMSKKISDEVIIVSEYDPLSAAGVERLKQVAGDDLGYGRTWVLLNKMLPEFVDKFSEFLSVAKYLPPIPWNAEVVRAYARRETALDLDWGNEFTLAIKRTIGALLGEYIRNDLRAWSKERTYALKAPLDSQYKVAEEQLANALKAKRRLALWRKLRTGLSIYLVASVVLGALVWLVEMFQDDGISYESIFAFTAGILF